MYIILEAPSRSRVPRPPIPIEAQSHPQLVVLASIDLRSKHGRLVSARVSASLRNRQKGRSASGLILMQQGRKSSGGQGLPDRAAEEQATKRGGGIGLERPPRQKCSKSTLCLRFSSGPFFVWAVVSSEEASAESYLVPAKRKHLTL